MNIDCDNKYLVIGSTVEDLKLKDRGIIYYSVLESHIHWKYHMHRERTKYKAQTVGENRVDFTQFGILTTLNMKQDDYEKHSWEYFQTWRRCVGNLDRLKKKDRNRLLAAKLLNKKVINNYN